MLICVGLEKRPLSISKEGENPLIDPFRYVKKQVSQAYKPTIGADFHSKKVDIEVNNEIKTVTLQVIT